MNHKKRKARASARMLSMLLAVLMCTAFAVEVMAETIEETAPTVSTAPTAETIAEETPVEETTAQEIPVAEVSAEALQEAKEAFLALLPEKTKAQYTELIQSQEWADAFCREDILAALQLNVKSLEAGNEDMSLRGALTQTVQEQEFLTEEQRTYYLNTIDGMQAELGEYPSEELLNSLSAFTEVSIATTEANNYLTCAEAQITSLKNLSDLLDTMELWQDSNAQVALLSEQLNDGQSSKNAVMVRCNELVAQAARMNDEVNTFFALDAEAQQQLIGELRAFSGGVDAFLVDTVLDNAQKLTVLQEETQQVTRKQVLVYVALGVGGLAVLIGVIAVVMVATKRPEKPPVDVSTLMSREAGETLDNQHRILDQKMKQLDQKVDNTLAERTKQLEEKVRQLDKTIAALEKAKDENPRPCNDPPIGIPPEPEKPRKVGYLDLKYSVIAPTTSYFRQVDRETEYVLYADNTVEYVNMQPNAMNTLSGWSSGVLFAFNPVLNGQQIPSANYSMYPGFYKAEATLRRAMVNPLPSGTYTLSSKGSVVMNQM